MRQTYTKEFLQNILDQYPNKGQIIKYFLFTSGFENSNYYVTTEQGEYVIKIFDGMGMKEENILFEIELMLFCTKNKLKTPALYETKAKEWHVKNEGKIAIVMGYIDGTNCLKKKIAKTVIKEIGEQAGNMDAVLKKFSKEKKARENYEWDMKNFVMLEKAIDLLPTEYDKEFILTIFNDFKKIKPVFDKAKNGIIHNDIAAHNILVKENELKAIIDFSDAAYSPYVQNVAVFFCQSLLTYNWAPEDGKLFLQAYEKHYPLSQEERDILYDCIRARFATIIVEFNRWNRVYGEDAQRTEYIKDHYEFLQKFSEIGRQKFKEIIL